MRGVFRLHRYRINKSFETVTSAFFHRSPRRRPKRAIEFSNFEKFDGHNLILMLLLFLITYYCAHQPIRIVVVLRCRYFHFALSVDLFRV